MVGRGRWAFRRSPIASPRRSSAEILVQGVGWRGLFAILAAASAAVALLILIVVPEKKQDQIAGAAPNVGFSTVFRDARF
jgi:predicted MFS family arabinose efflux permease